MFGSSLDLFGQPVITHFKRLKSTCDHFTYFYSLCIYGWMCCTLSIVVTRLFAYAIVVHAEGGVLKSYPGSSFSIHLKSGSENMINR